MEFESSSQEYDQPKQIYSTALHRVHMEQSCGRPTTPKWQHQRHIIAASRFIIRLFKCNPAYQCSPMDPNAPNFYEQLLQFYEIMGNSCSISTINVTDIKQRIETIISRIKWKSSYKADLCLPEIAKLQLLQLFTTAELREYETLRCHLQERRSRINLSKESRQRDALHAMLGYECLQLRYSALRNTLMLRWPHYQSTISESYLLLCLGQVGYYYKRLQLHEQRLRQFGEIGRELSICLLSELHLYFEFCMRQREEQNQSLLHLFWQTRGILHRFCWLLQLCIGLSCRQPLLNCLQLQLNVGNEQYNKLLESWLLAATQPLLARISNWLVSGELSDEEFFIVTHKDSNPTHYWQSHFKLVEEQLPPFLNSQLAQQLLNAGKCQDYAKQFLGLRLNATLKAAELQQQLSQACVQCYQQLEQQAVEQLIGQLERETAQELFIHLNQWVPTPLELLSKLHQYLLLTDVQFVGQLIELLEPALQQPYDYYDTHQLNNMLEQVFNGCIEPLYVAESFYPGHHCWQRFLLRWQQPPHWLPLIGHSLAQYESCFVCIWQLHYADYVLNERIGRQQLHFHERINFDDSSDVRSVRDRLATFIQQLQDFMHKLRSYVLHDVLDSAFQSLSLGCMTAKTLDDLLQIHGAYLNSIYCGILQGKQCLKSQQYLGELYEIIMQLDAVQQKFIALPFNQSIQSLESLQNLRWYCQHTCDSIDDLAKQFQLGLSNFLLTLYYTREPQFVALARRLDHHGCYEQKYTQLQQVHTFRFQRKIIADH
ncbi:GH10382 [Drosophila grimshawi]|uniref:Gamma-tubulin complex component n=2 Tax=Drosophila grimshawi TaxID=7222 RepID=B4JED7_DROGR|nr:GH10382 [Drosophila grimshawi]